MYDSDSAWGRVASIGLLIVPPHCGGMRLERGHWRRPVAIR